MGAAVDGSELTLFLRTVDMGSDGFGDGGMRERLRELSHSGDAETLAINCTAPTCVRTTGVLGPKLSEVALRGVPGFSEAIHLFARASKTWYEHL